MIWSEQIDGKWSDAIDLHVDHIDPGHVTDENGKRYLFLSDNYLVPLSDDGLSVTGKMVQVLKAPQISDSWDIEGAFPEAPNVFKRGEYYYLTYADGGTSGPATSHMIMSARAKNLVWTMGNVTLQSHCPYLEQRRKMAFERAWSFCGRYRRKMVGDLSFL